MKHVFNFAALAAAGCLLATAAEPAKSGKQPVRGAPIQKLAPAAPTNAAPATPVAKAPPAALGAVQKDGEFLIVGFDRLAAFNYDIPDEAPAATNAPVKPVAPPKEQIPANVKAFDKQRVALKGFMLPLKVEGGLITELLIMRDQSMCCYGTVPKINEWVSVKMTGKGVKPIMDQAVTLYGKLHVGEIRENGYLVGIYQMDGEKVAGPLDL
ncbi:MAG: Uncharacterized protein FD161_929 [Limisphaerales bacterium]|nr:MAG: Uncharacterized protein FD161_929 [Limisphaerales bacterium]KAG0509911.1 MAG: Uncharacterized protein E1N63_929 [Limisphaerales bacterium]TXT50618.1 MAG: Uncharacterized protein FD140_2250 [Limisphaerales bacterium]